MQPAIFLDRDGTLVADTGFPHLPAHYKLLPGCGEGLRLLARAGYALVIITNQSGVGRGIFGEAAFHNFQRLLLAELQSLGVEIAGVYMCPHRPDQNCACRKPRPGLFWRARDELDLTLGESWGVGDSPRDAEAALAAGCRGAVHLGAPPAARPELPAFADLPSAARWILEQREH